MDILKILSRGTSRQIRPAPGTQTAAAATNLPSAGSRANPQLFHDDVVTSKKLKRKRKRDQEDLQRGADAVEEDEVSDVDFFAPPKEARPKQVQDAEHQAAAEAEQAQKRTRERKTKLLSEEECRQLLKSHRLKLTLLSSADDKTSKVKKSSRKGGGDNKKKEKKAVVAAVETKEEMRQLYPQLLTSFAQLRSTYEISHRLAENIENESYKLPTEVQMASLPLLLDPKVAFSKSSSEAQQLGAQHDDVHFMAVAPTGSGKTLSFLVPAMNDVLRRRAEPGAKDKGHHELEVVIVAP
ncbi:MAG: DEAD/DEAH box helicase, partial [Thaumarchaeota archaeon]|nr:DEAD/DEAH box helicase [Nitrososphaerota archaeon]